MEQLVVRLGTAAEQPVYWLVWSTQESEIIASGTLADAHALDTLAERAGQRPITVLVPTADVYLTQVPLPAKASRKALGAIPYMLEDTLSSDIGDQFFALGPRVDENQCVAVVNHQKMQQWQQLIAESGLFCDKILPDVLALPSTQDEWSLLNLGDDVLVRQGEWNGIQGHKDWVLPALQHVAKTAESPLQFTQYNPVDVLAPAMSNIEWRTAPLDMPMQVLAEGALAASFNLLQGEYKAKRQSNNSWGKWRLAATLAGVALLVSLVDKGLTLSQLNSEKAELTAQIRQEFKRAFPETKRVVNVRSQMRQKMAALEKTGGSISMLLIMSELSPAFDSTQVKPQNLRFDATRSELRFQAAANNFEALEQFKRLAEEKGFEVQQGAINNRDDQVVGSLSIRS